MKQFQPWLHAFRLRTLPLAFSSILLGGALAGSEGSFDKYILLMALVTTLFLQILSNLANDYGDFVKGTDNDDRIGPRRTLQAGLISVNSMKSALFLFSLLSLLSGVLLLYVAGAFSEMNILIFFLGLGVICITAAITYTVGKNAYGYKGLGDISVLLFFGIVGVLGTHFLMTKHVTPSNFWMALSNGLMATGVLNINNLRDIENDKASGKNSIPVMIGFEAGKNYQVVLIIFSFLCLAFYYLSQLQGLVRLSIILVAPLFVWHIYFVKKTKEKAHMDRFLKQLALTSLLITIVVAFTLNH